MASGLWQCHLPAVKYRRRRTCRMVSGAVKSPAERWRRRAASGDDLVHARVK